MQALARTVVGPDGRPSGFRDWNDIFDLLAASARQGDADDTRMIYLVARSPDAPAAVKVLRNIEVLSAAGITIAAVFHDLPKGGLGARLLDRLTAAYGADGLRRYVRIADHAGWRTQHEMIHFGRIALLSGAPLGSASCEPAIDTVADLREQAETAELARLAFSTLWLASSALGQKQALYWAPQSSLAA